MKPWKPILTTRCVKCNKDVTNDGLPFCKKHRKEISEKILDGFPPTIKHSDVTKKVGWFQLITRIKNWFRRWRELKEEERENENLILKSGSLF